jgi:glucuronate isomerase
MKKFLDENFLLYNSTAEYLYHEHAAKMPILDYHCHLSPAQIARNDGFENLTRAWLSGDHYKWRAMRTHGVDEYFCTGEAPDREKFEKWAETVPFTLRNPLYHWTHLELQRYFGISDLLRPETAGPIYEQASAMLRQEEFHPRGLLKKMKVEMLCTTDDPIDTLEFHRQIRNQVIQIRVFPTWRPDKLFMVNNTLVFNEYLNSLERISDSVIGNYDQLLMAILKRHDFFHENGCRMSDHGLEYFYTDDYTGTGINLIFNAVRKGNDLEADQILKFRSALLHDLAVMDHEKGWTQQFHIGAMRNNNSRMFELKGPDTGFDSIGDYPVAESMSHFLDKLNRDHKLAKTILYNLNPADNEVMATMTGNFQEGQVPGKVQWGSAWWFLDQKDGMEKQLNTLSNFGLLAHFVGMLTDSRSFLSFPRHEYFRRILCNLIGSDVEKGEIPDEKGRLGKLVEDICYHNAKQYFDLLSPGF